MSSIPSPNDLYKERDDYKEVLDFFVEKLKEIINSNSNYEFERYILPPKHFNEKVMDVVIDELKAKGWKIHYEFGMEAYKVES